MKREVYKLGGRKNSPGINGWGLGVPISRGVGKLLKINWAGGSEVYGSCATAA